MSDSFQHYTVFDPKVILSIKNLPALAIYGYTKSFPNPVPFAQIKNHFNLKQSIFINAIDYLLNNDFVETIFDPNSFKPMDCSLKVIK